MILITSFVDAWKKAFDFQGVTTRREFWYFILSSNLFILLLNILIDFCSFFRDFFRGFDYLWFALLLLEFVLFLFELVVLLHFFGTCIVATSIFVRRLRDVGKHWLWYFVPLWNIYLCTKPAKKLITENNT